MHLATLVSPDGAFGGPIRVALNQAAELQPCVGRSRKLAHRSFARGNDDYWRQVWHTRAAWALAKVLAFDGQKSGERRSCARSSRPVSGSGVDVLPRHFYSQIPDIRALKADRSWQRPYSLVGVGGADLEQQLSWLREVCPPDVASILPSLNLQEEAGRANGALGYGPIEADVLYSVVRTAAPRRMTQIGAGASTWISLKAAEDAGRTINITCVDPFPTGFLKQLHRTGSIALRDVPVQALPASELADLEAGDILFIDSTHTVSPGSNMNHMILEVLPRLRKGVLVHFHDITIPYGFSPTSCRRICSSGTRPCCCMRI